MFSQSIIMKNIIIVIINLLFTHFVHGETLLISHKGFHNLNRVLSSKCQVQELISRDAPPEFTIESIEKAFEFGADMVEIDLRLTKDKKLVIFHDGDMECITGKNKNIGDLTYTEMKNNIDLGYNISFDFGRNFPLRGKGYIGPVLFSDILKKFPGRKFLLNPKDKSDEEAKMIMEILGNIPQEQHDLFSLWGREKTHRLIKNKLPHFGEFYNNHWQSDYCLNDIRSYAYFSGEIPVSCWDKVISLDIHRTWLLPDWSGKMIDRLREKNTKVYFFVPQSDIPFFLFELFRTKKFHAFIVSDIKNFTNFFNK